MPRQGRHGRCKRGEPAFWRQGAIVDEHADRGTYAQTSEEFWMNLQSNYERSLERQALRDKIAAITPLQSA